MNIIETIHFGLRRGYYQYRQFGETIDGFEKKMTEYLLTVFVAIELYKSDYSKQVKIEYPLWEFYMNAFPKIKWKSKNDIFDKSEFIKREYKKEKTKQRIDIAITKVDMNMQIRSVNGIELKAINTNYEGVIIDLVRLSDAMINNDPIDNNSILSCYSGFIKSYKNNDTPSNKEELLDLRRNIIKKIKSLLNDNFRNNPKYNSLYYSIDLQEIDSLSSEEYFNQYSEIPDFDLDYYEATNNTGEVLSIVIEINRK